MSLKENLRVLGKRTSDSLHAAYYNRHSKKAAFCALGQIQNQKGKLSSLLKKRTDAYAIEVLGGKQYVPWLYVYTALTGEFKEGWIPDNYYHLVVIPRIQGDYGKLSFLKPLNQKFFSSVASPDIAFFVNGVWYDPNLVKLPRNALRAIAFAKTDRVVFKMDQSFQGHGIRIYDEVGFNIAELESSGNGTLQRYIEQHPFFSDFHSGSVATLRMTTVINTDGKAEIRTAYLRLGCGTDTHVKSDSHIRIPVDYTSGALYPLGYSPDWQTTAHHKDSLIPFCDKTIPGYQNVVRTAVNLHQGFPLVGAIGWDFAVDHENCPILMEWNGYGNDIKFSEATQGPCFKDMGWDKLKIR